MNSRTVTTSQILSAMLLAVSVSPADARLGYLAAVSPQPAAAQKAAVTQPSQTEPEGTFSPGPSPPPIVSERAIPLGGNTPEQQFLPGSLTVSPDSSTIAYRLRYGKHLEFDGYIVGGLKPIGASRATNPTFSPDGKTIAVVTVERGWKLKHDKEYVEGFEPVTKPVFSPDGQRIMYLARLDKQRFVVEGDQAHPLAESIAWDQLVFTPDSAVVAYPAFDGQHWRMVINGDPGPTWDRLTTPPIVAPNGSRVLYIATKNGRYHVVDRHTPAPTDTMKRAEAGFRLIDQPPVFSGDGRAFAYWALGDDMVWRAYQNHVPVPGYEADRPGQLLLNDDGQTLIAILKRNERWHVVRDGVLSPPYTAVGKDSLVLSPDGSRLVYAVKKPRGWAVVENGIEHPTYTTLAAHSLRFSPDSQRFVYAALIQGQWSVIESPPAPSSPVMATRSQSPVMARRALAGVASTTHPFFNKIATRSLTFSPDSRHLAYIAYNAGTANVVRDGLIVGEYDAVAQLTFNPKSDHLVWLATDHGQSFLVADGTPSTETFDGPVPGSHIHFVNNLLCHTAVIRRPGPTFARIELKLSVPEEAPIPGNDGDYDPDTTPAPATPTEPESPLVEVPID